MATQSLISVPNCSRVVLWRGALVVSSPTSSQVKVGGKRRTSVGGQLLCSTQRSSWHRRWYADDERRQELVAEAVQEGKTSTATEGSFNPQTIEQAISQAWGAVQRAIADGKKRQQLQFLLPVDQRQFNYLDTEPRDYPCGIIQEFAVCQKVVSALLRTTEKTEIVSRRIGEAENEMDPVGLIYPSNKTIAAIVFPIVETLKQIRSLASKDENMPLLLVNPQWRSTGNVISDFGFGPWRREKEDYVNTFATTYSLIEQRVGEASNITAGYGGVVRILKCYPSDWQVYLMAWDGSSELIGEFQERPAYKELEQLVIEARKRIPWKAPPRILGGSEPAPPPFPSSLSRFLSDSQIDEMEVTEVRRALMALDLPSSGRFATLKDRLKEAHRKLQGGG